MNLLGIVLVAASCFGHAAYNFIAKQAIGRADFFWWMTLAMGVGFAIPGVASLATFPLPTKALICAPVSGFFLGVYFTSLTMAYRHGDLSIVYPLARATPIFILACAGMLMGVHYDRLGLVGLAIIIAGALILPLRAGDGLQRWLNRGNLWALLTGVATAGYSLFDRQAMTAVADVSGGPLGLGARTVGYLWLQFSIALAMMTPLLRWAGARPKRRTWRIHRRSVVAVAVINGLSYGMVLVAMQTNKVTYIIAFRQLSIVLTVLLGVSFLAERRGAAHRLLGACVITVGLVLVALAK